MLRTPAPASRKQTHARLRICIVFILCMRFVCASKQLALFTLLALCVWPRANILFAKASRCYARGFVYGRKYLRATLAVNLSRKSSPPLLIIHSRVIDLCNMNAAGVLTEAAAEKEIQSRAARLSPLYSTTADAWWNIYVYVRGAESKTWIACFMLHTLQLPQRAAWKWKLIASSKHLKRKLRDFIIVACIDFNCEKLAWLLQLNLVFI